MKADLDLVKAVLQRNELDVRQVAQILNDITQEVTALVDDEKTPAVKKQFVILVSLPLVNSRITHGEVQTGWVVQIAEEEDSSTADARLIAAARAYNTSPKGRRIPVKTFAEICEHVPAKFLKEAGVFVRTKEPVYVIPVVNKF